MKSFSTLATLALLFSSSFVDAKSGTKGKMILIDADGKTQAKSESGSAAAGDSFTVEALVTEETAFIQLQLKGNDASCVWAYKTTPTKKAKSVTKSISACDYEIRSVSGKTQ